VECAVRKAATEKSIKQQRQNYKKQSHTSPPLPSLSFPFFSPNRILLRRLSSGKLHPSHLLVLIDSPSPSPFFS